MSAESLNLTLSAFKLFLKRKQNLCVTYQFSFNEWRCVQYTTKKPALKSIKHLTFMGFMTFLLCLKI